MIEKNEDLKTALAQTDKSVINEVVVFKTEISTDPYTSVKDHHILKVKGNLSELAKLFSKDEAPIGTYKIGDVLSPLNRFLDGNWIRESNSAWLKSYTGRLNSANKC